MFLVFSACPWLEMTVSLTYPGMWGIVRQSAVAKSHDLDLSRGVCGTVLSIGQALDGGTVCSCFPDHLVVGPLLSRRLTV